MRSVPQCVAVLALAAALGCGGSGGSGGSVGSGGKSAADLKAELFDTAKRMEGGQAAAVVDPVTVFESGRANWGWSIIDEKILHGDFTPETKAAYKKWREAKIAEDKTKKK